MATCRGALLAATVLGTFAAAGPSFAQSQQHDARPAVAIFDVASRAAAGAHGENGLSEDVIQSTSCVLTGTAATALAIGVGGENLINLIAGGVVVPGNRLALYIGLVGVVFASFCQIGQALTPLYLYMTGPAPAPTTVPAGRDAGGPPAVSKGPQMRTAQVHGVLASAVYAPPLREAMPAMAPPRHSMVATAGVPGLTRAAR